MKTKLLGLVSSLGVVLAAYLSAAPANASLYNNGPSGYSTDSWTINHGFAIADSFSLAGSSTITSIDFVTWSYPSTDVLSSVNWAITSTPFGSAIDSGTSPVTSSFITTNTYGFTINSNTISPSAFDLAAGSYWLQLSGAVVTNGDPIYWDESDQASLAWASSVGELSYNGGGRELQCKLITCSETFQINGSSGVGQTPLPSTWTMLIAGFVGLGFFAYRGTKKRTAFAAA
jgi:hypothetical protein